MQSQLALGCNVLERVVTLYCFPLQLPGGERVPFLFSLKGLDAKGTLSAFGGDFVVPSYRGSTFLDPKVGVNGPQVGRGCCMFCSRLS